MLFLAYKSDLHLDESNFVNQGWAAALANLEDSVTALEKRFSRFKDTYSSYLEKREHYTEVIDQFDEDLHVLNKIPVLPALLEDEDSGHGSNVNSDTSRQGSSMFILLLPSIRYHGDKILT